MSVTTYRITSLAGTLGTVCPPPIVESIFPAFDGWPCVLDGEVCTVTAPSPQTPADLGPLVKVETLSN